MYSTLCVLPETNQTWTTVEEGGQTAMAIILFGRVRSGDLFVVLKGTFSFRLHLSVSVHKKFWDKINITSCSSIAFLSFNSSCKPSHFSHTGLQLATRFHCHYFLLLFLNSIINVYTMLPSRFPRWGANIFS